MTTTLVTQRRARPGQAASLAEAAIRLFRTTDAWSPAQFRLRLFQGRQEPELLLAVSDWTSRAAAQRRLEASPIPAELDALTIGQAEHGYYHTLTTYEAHTAPVAVATCTRVTCSRSAIPRLLAYLTEVTGPLMRAQPGLVRHTLYQDEDQPTHFLSMRGYESTAALEAVQRAFLAEITTALRERGGRVTHFVGRPVADIARAPDDTMTDSPVATLGPQ